MAEEWISGGVGGSNIRSMRKKIYKHRDSLAHQKALGIKKQREKEVLPNMAATVTASLFEETANALRTASFVAKERLAFTKNELLGFFAGNKWCKNGPVAQVRSRMH